MSTPTTSPMSSRPTVRRSTPTSPVPTLYLHGANDGALGADLLTDVDAHLPTEGSVAEIVEGIGHFLHLEQPRLIAEKITGWLAG
jgi:pimeloyl-ACP methyl ester carboxylesterase